MEREAMIESETPRKKELRRSDRLGCQKELMKKPGKVKKHSSASNEEKHSSASNEEKHSSASNEEKHSSASNEEEHSSASNEEEHFDRDSNSANNGSDSDSEHKRFIAEKENSHGYAESGLKLYQKNNNRDATLFDSASITIRSFKKLCLFQLGSNLTEFWKHVCFTAKPENGGASPEYYFLVEVKKRPGDRWEARRCWMFEPKDVAGMDHGCRICTNEVKIHPVAGQYYAGHTLTCRDATKGFQQRGIVDKDFASTKERHYDRDSMLKRSSTSTQKHFYRDSMIKFLKNFEYVSDALKSSLEASFAYARDGLGLYGKINKDTLFDIRSIEILTFERSRLLQLGTSRSEFWRHVCFTVKRENNDASPKYYFLVEVMRDHLTRWKARRCWMFENKDDVEGAEHGCIICTNEVKCHPVPGQYYAGHNLTCLEYPGFVR